MGYNPNPNLYNPSVLPDQQGLAPGISAFTDSFTGLVAQGLTARHANKQRLEERSWQTQDRNAAWAREDQQMGAAKSEREALRNQKLMEDNEAADASLGAALIAYQGVLPSEMVEVANKARSPEAKRSYADMIAQYGADKLRAAGDQAMLEEKSRLARQTTPVEGTDYVMTGNGQALPMRNRSAGPSPEALAEYGFQPQSYKSPDGVVYTRAARPNEAPVETFPLRNADGKVTGFQQLPSGYVAHPLTGEPVKTPPGESDTYHREVLKRKAQQETQGGGAAASGGSALNSWMGRTQ